MSSRKPTQRHFLSFFRKKKRITEFGVRVKGGPPANVRIVTFFGILCIGSGLWMCKQCHSPFFLTGECNRYKAPGKILLFAGSLLISTGIVAAWAASELIRVAITSLKHALAIALVMEATAGAASFSMHSTVSMGSLNVSLLEELQAIYSVNDRFTYSMDELQADYGCCGVRGPSDWSKSLWIEHFNSSLDILPMSCCSMKGKNCTESGTHNEKGCGAVATICVTQMLYAATICAFVCLMMHVTSYLVLCFLEKRA